MDRQEVFIEMLYREIKGKNKLEAIDLLSLAKSIYQYYTGEEYIGKVAWSNRLKTSGANIRFDPLKNTGSIQVNRLYIEKFGEEELIDILKHELTHYYLYRKGQLKHGHGKGFKETLQDIFKSNCIVAKYNEGIYQYQYQCQHCGAIYKSFRRIHKKIYCSKCVKGDHGKFKAAYRMLIKD
ncbi:MAG: SprT-like domain-containing protein [Thermotaleaceae bacterium]